MRKRMIGLVFALVMVLMTAVAAADMDLPKGDTLFDSYCKKYGYFGEWDQETWVKLGKEMEPEEPICTLNAYALKKCRYPEENTADIGREEAKALALKASGIPEASVDSCILMEAEPHPVWKVHIITDGPADPVLELDAETGEVTATETYKHNYTPEYVLFTTQKAWRAMELEHDGAWWIAIREVAYAYLDLNMNDPSSQLAERTLYHWEEDGLTTRFTGRWAGMKSYLVELDENGFVLRCEETDTDSTTEMPELDEDGNLPMPTPRPDGKPWFWGQEIKDEAYWNRMERAMANQGVTAENFEKKQKEWEKKYGREAEWPQECTVIKFFFTLPDYDTEGIAECYPLFSQEGKPTLEEMKAKALEEFKKAIAGQKKKKWMDGLRANGQLLSDAWNDTAHERYNKPVWCMRIERYEKEDGYKHWVPKGYVMLDEDGNIEEVVPELNGGG